MLEVGIKGGARNLGRDDVGEIAPGFAADFVAWRTDAIGFAGAMKDPVAALVFCTPSIGWVDLSVINGDVIVQDGKLQTLDLKASKLCCALWLRLCDTCKCDNSPPRCSVMLPAPYMHMALHIVLSACCLGGHGMGGHAPVHPHACMYLRTCARSLLRNGIF